MNMRETTKSLLTLPWALSMFGLQQASNLLAPTRDGDRLANVGQAFDAVTNAARRDFQTWAKQSYEFGNNVQQVLVDVMLLKPPQFESSKAMRMAAEMQDSRVFHLMMKYGMPPVGWLGSKVVAGKDSDAVSTEFANKLKVIEFVTHANAMLGIKAGETYDFATLTAKAGTLETFPRLWVVEGIGNYLGDHAVARDGDRVSGLLNGPDTAQLPLWSMTMLHAGIGMSFAKHVLEPLSPKSSPEELRSAVTRFLALCRASSRPGYTGAAIESLGLAARTLYPDLLYVLDPHIAEVAPEAHGYFWHGAGRAMYFEAANWMPWLNAPWRAVREVVDAPHDVARRNLLAGLAWALTVVNMRHPIVMEAFLRHHGTLAIENDAFTNGVVSALTMRYDTTRDDARIRPFIHHEPAGDQDLASRWRVLVGQPCEDAIERGYPRLRAEGRLEEVFHYRPVT